MKLSTIFATFLLGSLAIPMDRVQSAPAAKTITDVRVIDGDTISGSIDNVKTSVRLCGIDAPERKQPLSAEAKQLLERLIEDKSLVVMVLGRDRYRRTIGSLYANGQSVQSQLSIAGAVLFYSSSGKCPDRQLIIEGENYARSHKLGIHAVIGFIPPWEFRRQARLKK